MYIVCHQSFQIKFCFKCVGPRSATERTCKHSRNTRIKFAVCSIIPHVPCYNDRKFPKNKHLYLWNEPRRWLIAWHMSYMRWFHLCLMKIYSTKAIPCLISKEINMSVWWGRSVHNLFLMYPDFRPHLKGAGQHATLSFPDYPAS